MPTIGVALAIPEPWGTQLQDYRTSIGDAHATLIPTHITLIPPVEVEEADLPALHVHLDRVAAAHDAFGVHLRGTGTFRPVSPVVFVTVAEGIGGCEQLALALREGPLEVSLQFPYHPHVTVAHHLPDELLDRAFADLAEFECVFRIDAIHLFEHDESEGWRPTREFGLAALAD